MPAEVAAAGTGNLPFTEFDVTGAVVLGLLMLGVGVVGRRMMARRPGRSS